MTNRPKAIGTSAESALVGYLRTTGWPHAERRALAGSTDLGDVVGCLGLAWEAKAGAAAERAQDAHITAWLAQTETERRNARADLGILVTKRAGRGTLRVGDWWAWVPAGTVTALMTAAPADPADGPPVRLRLADLVELLRTAGYGDPTIGDPA